MTAVNRLWEWSNSSASRAVVRYVWVAVVGLGVVAMLVAMMANADPSLGAVLGIPIAIGLVRDRGWAFEWTKFVNTVVLIALPVVLVLHLRWPHLTTVNFFGWRFTNLGRLWFACSLLPVAVLGIWTLRAFNGTTERPSGL